MTFAMVSGVEKEDVNILLAGQHEKQANATESKATLGTVLGNLGPLFQNPSMGLALKVTISH